MVGEEKGFKCEIVTTTSQWLWSVWLRRNILDHCHKSLFSYILPKTPSPFRRFCTIKRQCRCKYLIVIRVYQENSVFWTSLGPLYLCLLPLYLQSYYLFISLNFQSITYIFLYYLLILELRVSLVLFLSEWFFLR